MPRTVRIRFYEELNDFLPQEKRKTEFEHTFWGQPSAKDIIESLGIPHTEVDMILVNGKSIDFNYHPKNNDRISVYPVFESLDISEITHLRPRPLREVKFVLDVHLGRLARYLRMLGFDTLYENDLDDSEIILISLQQNRIILTRDLGILRNGRVTHGYWIRSRYPKDQLKEVIGRLDLYRMIKPFNRCMECNGKIVITDKQSVLEHIKEGTRESFEKFYRCKKCGKIYWQGSHYQRMKKMIDTLKPD